MESAERLRFWKQNQKISFKGIVWNVYQEDITHFQPDYNLFKSEAYIASGGKLPIRFSNKFQQSFCLSQFPGQCGIVILHKLEYSKWNPNQHNFIVAICKDLGYSTILATLTSSKYTQFSVLKSPEFIKTGGKYTILHDFVNSRTKHINDILVRDI